MPAVGRDKCTPEDSCLLSRNNPHGTSRQLGRLTVAPNRASVFRATSLAFCDPSFTDLSVGLGTHSQVRSPRGKGQSPPQPPGPREHLCSCSVAQQPGGPTFQRSAPWYGSYCWYAGSSPSQRATVPSGEPRVSHSVARNPDPRAGGLFPADTSPSSYRSSIRL